MTENSNFPEVRTDEFARLPVMLRIEDVKRELGIGRTSIYELINDGSLEKIKIAGRSLVTRASLARLIEDARSAELNPRDG